MCEEVREELEKSEFNFGKVRCISWEELCNNFVVKFTLINSYDWNAHMTFDVIALCPQEGKNPIEKLGLKLESSCVDNGKLCDEWYELNRKGRLEILCNLLGFTVR